MDPLLDKNIISTKAASELSGYSPDYLSRLARSGKIRGTQVGRTWVVQKESLLEFMGTQGKRKEELARALARTRANEYRERTKAAFTPRTFTFARAPKIERTPRHAPIRVPVSFIRHAASALAALVVVSGAAYAAEAADFRSIAQSVNGVAVRAQDGLAIISGNFKTYAEEKIADARASADRSAANVSARVEAPAIAILLPTDLSLFTAPQTSAVRAEPAPIFTVSAKNEKGFFASLGERGLAVGSFVRDALQNAPRAALRADLAFAASIVDGTHAILNGYGNGARAWTVASPEVAKGTVLAVYRIGDAVASAAGAAPSLALRSYNRAVFALADAANESAASAVRADIAFGTWLQGSSAATARLALLPFADAGEAAYRVSSASSASIARTADAAQTLAGRAPFSVSKVAAALTAAGRPLEASVAPAEPGTLRAFLPEPVYGFASAIALSTYRAVNGALGFGLRTLAYAFGPVPQVALAPVVETGYAVPAAPVPAPANAEAAPTGTVTTITKYVSPTYTTIGVDKGYVDARIGELQNFVYANVNSVVDNLHVHVSSSGSSGGGSGSVTSVNASGGSTGLSFSGGPITSSGTLTLSGILGIANGGTGTTTAPSYGQVLVGDASGNYELVATSSLGISAGGSPAWGSIIGTLSNQTDLQNALNAKFSLSAWYATTSDALAEGSVNKYFTQTRFDNALSATTSLPNITALANLGTVKTTLTGILRATAGVLSTGAINLASGDVSGILPVANGGTGWGAIQSGAIPYGNGTGALATTTAGTNGQTLALVNGIPTWVATTTFSSGLAYSGGNVTNTGVLSNIAGAGIGVSGATGNVTISNTGLLSLQQTGGGTAQTGAITFASSSQTTNGQTVGLNITNTAGAFTFAPTISGTLTVAGGGTGQTSFTSGNLVYGAGSGALQNVATSSVSNGSGISVSGGGAVVGAGGLTISNTGLLSLQQSSGSAQTGAITLATSTTAVSNDWGITNTGGTFTFNLPTASASVRGLLSASDFSTFSGKQAALAFTYPLVNSANTISLAFGTTTSNTWAGTQTFTNNPILGTLTGLIYGNSGTLAAAATSSFTPSGEFTTTGTIGAFVGGANSTLALATNGVALTKLATIGANSILGNATGATGNVTAIATSSLGIALSDTTGTLAVSRGGTNASSQSTNGVNYFNGTSITSDNTQLFFNGTSLGVASSAPWGQVSINPSALGSGVPEFVIGSSSATHFTVAGSGFVGIGTTNPQRQLTIQTNNSGTPSTVALYNTNTTDADGLGISFRADTTGTGATAFKEFTSIQTSYDTHDNATAASALHFYTTTGGTEAERFRIANNGNVGVGATSTPGSIFSVNSIANFSTGTSSIYTGLNIAALNITGSATSTAANGFNIAAGCYAVNGVCLSLGSLGGTLPVSHGGTGATSFTSGNLVYGAGSGALQSVATTTFTPSGEFTTTGTIGSFVGGANSTLALATNGVALTKLATIGANSILGNATGATGNVTAIATSTLNIGGTAGNVTGIVSVANGGTGWGAIQSGAIPYGNGTGALATTTAGTNGQTLALVNGIPTWVATTTLSTISGTLAQNKGGTGITSYNPGDILYADNSGNLAALPAGSAGQVLKVTGGLPAWGVDLTTGGGGGAGAWSTTTDSLGIYPTDTSNVVIIGSNATSTLTSIFEVHGTQYISGSLGLGTTSPASKLSIQGNGLFSGDVNLANLIATGTATVGNLSVGSLSGLLYGNTGAVAAATVNSPLSFSAGTLSLGTVDIANGGTGTTTGGVTNGVEYYDGSKITNSSGFVFDGTHVGIGATSNFNGALTLGGTIGTQSEGDIFRQYDSGDATWYPIIARYFTGNGTFPGSTYIFGAGPSANVGIEVPGGGDVASFHVKATNATFNNAVSVGSLSIGSLSGVLHASSGTVSASNVALGSEVSGVLPIANGGIGTSTAPTYGKLLIGDASGNYELVATSSIGLGTGSVTSVDASGGTTGLSFSGGPITSSGTLTLSGTLNIANGGTGATSFTSGNLLYGSGTGALQSVATTSVTCAGSAACTGFTVIGSSPITITGSGLTSYDAFTHTSVWGQTTSATSTLIALTGSPYALVASSTSVFDNASTTQFTSFNNTYLALNGGTVGVATTSPGNFGGGVAPFTVSGNIVGTKFINAGVTGGYQIGGKLLAYASSTNSATIFGLGAGGQNATTSASTAYTTAVGTGALTALTTGTNNTALGFAALDVATSSGSNTAIGLCALGGANQNFCGGFTFSGTFGSYNTALGNSAGFNLGSGSYNVALGDSAAFNQRNGSSNISIGEYAGGGNSSYSANGTISIGDNAGTLLNNGADYNTLIGYHAGYNVGTGYGNTLLGAATNPGNLTTGHNNIGLGYNTFFPSATGNNQLNIGGILFGTLPATTTAFALPTSGAIGIGTSTPFAKFAIQSNNGDTATTLFAIGSSTASATTTLFTIDNTGVLTSNGTATSTFTGSLSLPNLALTNNAGLLKAGAGGYIVNAVAGTDYLTSATGVTSIQQLGGGTAQTGAITLATSSDATTGLTLGLNITNASGAFTFAPTLSGTLNIANGGTGTTTGGVTNGVEYYNGSTLTNSSGFTFNPANGQLSIPSNGWYSIGGNLLAYASSTNGATVFGIGAGGQTATTSGSNRTLTAIGRGALSANSSGFDNTAVGSGALSANTTGVDNTAVGTAALNYNTSGQYTTAFGAFALTKNTASLYNTAVGYQSGGGNSSTYTSQGNTYVGFQSGYSADTNSNFNTLLGYRAGISVTGTGNTLIGPAVSINTLSSGNNNIGIGYNTLFPSNTGNNQLNIGNFIYGTLPATTTATAFGLPTTGNLAVGSSSPFAEFGIHANNGSAYTSLFAIGSSTATATTTLFAIDNAGVITSNASATSTFAGSLSLPNLALTNNSGLLKAGAGGYIQNAISGTDYLAPGSLSATYPIQYSSNTLSLAFGTTTSNTWAGTQTFTNPIAVGSGSGTSTFSGNIGVTGDIVPSAADTYSLGSSLYPFKDVFVGPGSLYVDGQEVVHTNVGDDVIVSADSGQNLQVKTSGGGALQLNPGTTGNIQVMGPVSVTAGKSITTTDSSALSVPSGVAAGNITVSGNAVTATNLNGGISLTPAGTGGTYVTAGSFGIGTTSPASKFAVSGNATIGADYNFAAPTNGLLVQGDVGIGTTSPGSVFSINSIANFRVGTSTILTGLNVAALNLTGSATSTAANGFNLTNGCFAINGACVTNFSNTLANGGTGTTTFYSGGVVYSDGTKLTQASNAGANRFFWDNTNSRLGLGTSTPAQTLSVQGNGLFSGDVNLANLTATGTVAAATLKSGVTNSLLYGDGSGTLSAVTINAPLVFSSGALDISLNPGAGIAYDAGTGTITNTGVRSIAQTYGTAQTGAVTYATSSDSTTGLSLGLNITNSGNAFTFTPTLSGTLGITNGGTGTSTAPTYGKLLIGDASGNYELVATSSLGLQTAGSYENPLTFTYPLQRSTDTISLAFGTTTSNTWAGTQTFTNNPILGTLTGLIYGNSGTLAAAATSSFTPSAEFTTTGTIGAFVGGANSTLALATNGVALTKLATIGANSILGNATGATGNVTAIATSSLGIALSDTTGTLAVSRGGTGQTSFTSGNLVYGAGSGALQSVATTSVSCAGSASCTGFTVIGSSPITITGSGLTSYDAFTHTSVWGQTTSATSTLIALTGSPYALVASSTSVFDNASTTQFTSFNNTYLALNGGRVGVGSTTPWAQFSINPSALGSGVPEFAIGSSTATHVVVTNTGKIGIGTTSPQALLTIQDGVIQWSDGANTGFNTNFFRANPSSAGVGWNSTVIGHNIASTPDAGNNPKIGRNSGSLTAASAFSFGTSNGQETIFNFWTGVGAPGTALSPALGITNTGRVGIGSTSPFSALSVSTSTANYTGQSLLAVANSSNATLFNVLGNGNVGVGTTSPGSLFAVNGVANFTTGTSTFLSTLSAPNLALTNNSGLLKASAGGYIVNAVAGTDYLTSSTGVTSIQQLGGGTAQTGAITLATSSDSTTGLALGLKITNSSGAFTFAPTLSGTLNVGNGGTGATSFTSGNLVYGAGSGALQSVATTSFTPSGEFTTTGTIGSFVGGANSTLALASNGVALTKLATIGANSILGNATGATGNVTAIATSSLGIALSDTTGTLAVSRGGTGTTTVASSQLLYGGGAGVYQSAATSSVTNGTGISFTGTPGALVGGTALTITNTGVLSFNSRTGAVVPASGDYTTDQVTEGTNKYYTDARVGSYITGSTTLPAFLNYWTKSGSNITYAGGRVGIGAGGNYEAPLHVNLSDVTGGPDANSLLALEDGAHDVVFNFLTGRTLKDSIYFGDQDNNDMGSIIYDNSTDAMSFSTNQVQRLVINSSGEVGIGTTSPSQVLSIQGNGLFSGDVSLANLTATGTATIGTLTGPLQANNGLVSATSSIGVLYGGTGLTSAPAYGNLLVGNSSGGYTLTATSSLGLGTGSVTSVDASGGTTGLSFSGGPITSSGTLTLSGTLGAANGGTGSTTLSGILVGNGTSAVNSLVLPSFLSLSGNTLSLNGALGIANGGTGTTTGGVTNGIEYYNGTNLTNGSGFVYNGGKVGIGTTSPWRTLSINGSSDLGVNALAGSFTATDTSATSTFAGPASFGSSYDDSFVFNYPFDMPASMVTIGSEIIPDTLQLPTALAIDYTPNFDSDFSTSTAIDLGGYGGNQPTDIIGVRNSAEIGYGGHSATGLLNNYNSDVSNATFNGVSNEISYLYGDGGKFYGLKNTTLAPTDNSGTFTAYGVYNDISNYSDDTTNVYGTYSIGHTFSDNTGTFYGNYVKSGSDSTGGTQYGTYVDLTAGTATKYAGIFLGGNVGIGTSSPFAKLSVQANNGDTATTLFAIGSSTASATTTLFTIDNTGILTSNALSSSTFASGLNIAALNVTGSATSTAANGFNITSGCYAVNGTCVGGSSFTNTLANGGTATTTFYSGGIVYSDGTKLTQAANSGNDTFFWDATNKRLGIGSTSPWAQLSINPNAISGPAFAVGSSTATSFVVTNGGAVGIGTSSPFAALSVKGGSGGQINQLANVLAVYGSAGPTAQPGQGIILSAGNAGGVSGTLGGAVTITGGAGSANNGGAGGAITLTAGNGNGGGAPGAITINPGTGTGLAKVLLGSTGGYVGIGTTTPGSELSVSTIAQQDGGISLFTVASTTNATLFNVLGNGNVGIGSSSPVSQLTVSGPWSGTNTYGNLALVSTDNDSSVGLSLINSDPGTDQRNWSLVSSYNRDGILELLHSNSSTGNPLVDNASLITFDGRNGYVSINDNNPGTPATLRVKGLSTQPTQDLFDVASSTGTFLFTISAAGNVGIGSSTPGSLLSIGTANGINFTTATTTFNSTGGINIKSGCFAVNGTCISAGTPFSNTLAGGGTATTTFFNTGVVWSDGTKLTQTPGFTFGGTNGQLSVPSNGWYAIGGQLLAYASSTSGVTILGLGAGGDATTSDFETAITAVGYHALNANTLLGTNNTAVGWSALTSNDFGTNNTAVGVSALYSNGVGSDNTANGYLALFHNDDGGENVAVGGYALTDNTGGTDNTAIGFQALQSNTTGTYNVANGVNALGANIAGNYNIAIGPSALNVNENGNENVAVGDGASINNFSATGTVAVGAGAAAGSDSFEAKGYTLLGALTGFNLQTGSDYNTLLGFGAGGNITTGAKNILIGADSTADTEAWSAGTYSNLTTGSNNIAIGNDISLPSDTADNQLNIGNFIYGTGLSGTGTTISSGLLGLSSTSPFAKLSIQANNGDTAKTLFAIGSSTASATTTLLSVLNTGNVGIGTVAPASLLTVAGSASIGNGYKATAAPSNGAIIEGHVGIGTLSPNSAAVLDAASSGVGSGDVYGVRSDISNYFGSSGFNVYGFYSALSSSPGPNSPPDNSYAFYGAPAGGLTNWGVYITGEDKNYFSGSVGIGTTSPGSVFAIDNIANFRTGTSTILTGLNVAALNITGSATSTAANGFNITSGCYAVNGTCISAGTPFSNTLAGGGTATTTFFNTGVVWSDGTKLTQTPGFTFGGTNGQLSVPSNGWYAQGGSLLAYASSTNNATIFGLNAGGQNATTSAALNSASAFGYKALSALTTGTNNTGIGTVALAANTTGADNTAVGVAALRLNTSGGFNVAVGENASQWNTAAQLTTAIGYGAAQGTSGYQNVGGVYLGYQSGHSVATGSNYNTLLGYGAGYSVSSGYGNTLIGANPDLASNISTGHNNIGIGYDATFPSASGDNQLNIGGLVYGTLPATTSAFALPTSGAIGIGTSTPFAKFAIQLNNGDTATTLFAIGSSTASATTTLFSVLNNGNIYAKGALNLEDSQGALVIGDITGNIRGSDAIDIQTIRSAAQVASHNGLAIGRSNTAGTGDIAIGASNSSTAEDSGSDGYSIAIGNSNSVSGYTSAAFGSTNSVTADFAYAIGANITNGTSNSLMIGPSNTAKLTILSSGNLGIGTTSPFAKLSVAGAAYVGGDLTATGTVAIPSLAAAAGAFLAVDGSGNVIATSTPGGGSSTLASLSDVSISSPTNGDMLLYNGSDWVNVATSTLGLGGSGGGSVTSVDASGGTTGLSFTGGPITSSGTLTLAGTLGIANGGTNATSQTTNGVAYYNGTSLTTGNLLTFTGTNFGIGTSSPFAKLSIQANNGDTARTLFAIGSSTASATTTLFSIDNTGLASFGDSSGTGDATFQFGNDTDAWSTGYSSSTKAFVIASSTNLSTSVALTILKSLNVGIGTTTPARALQVLGDIRTGTGGTNGCVENYAGTGLIGTCSSDARLKTVTGTITNVLPGLASLDLVNYHWNQLASSLYKNNQDATNTGFIAQQVAQVFPELVITDKNGYNQLNYTNLGLYGIEGVRELYKNTGWIGTASTTAASSTAPVLTFNPQTGNVGIATTTARHTLDVNGDLAAKTIIVPAGTGLSFNDGTTTFSAHVPDGALAQGGGVDLFKLATYTLADVEGLTTRLNAVAMRMDSLENRIKKLEDGSIAAATSSPLTFSTSTLATAMNDLGVLIQKGVAQFDTLVARQFVAAKDTNGQSIAGSDAVLAGNTVAEVKNAYAKSTSKILITMTSPVDGSWYLSDKQDGSFRVTLAKAQTADVTFDYFIIETEGQLASPEAATSTDATSTSTTTDSGVTHTTTTVIIGNDPTGSATSSPTGPDGLPVGSGTTTPPSTGTTTPSTTGGTGTTTPSTGTTTPSEITPPPPTDPVSPPSAPSTGDTATTTGA